MKVQTKFQGFGAEAFGFFRALARNNHKPWFDRHRHIYEEQVVGPLKTLFEELVPAVLALDAKFEISGKTGRNFSRINRDIRFARDKSPYRRNLYLYFRPRGGDADPRLRPAGFVGAGTRLYVGLSAEGVTCGLASYDGRDSALERLLKPRRAREPKRVERLLRRLGRSYEMYWHGTERGEWKKYAGAPQTEGDWKRCRALVVRRKFTPSRRELRSPAFARTVAAIFRRLFPLYALAALET